MAYVMPGLPSCTKTVTIRLGETVVKLKQRKEVTVNGEEIKIPVSLKNAYISQASSIFTLGIFIHLSCFLSLIHFIVGGNMNCLSPNLIPKLLSHI